MDAQDVAVRVDREREHLLAVLDGLDVDAWSRASACAGWTVRDLVVHLLMPYELSAPRFALLMVRARFRFDRLADRWARDDRRSPAQVLAALRATADQEFGVPGAPAEAPLSHLVLHAQDVYRPLGVPSPTDPDDARVVLEQVMTPAARRTIPAGLLDGLTFAATDSSWRWGDGPLVSGPGTALLPTLVGRPAALDDLVGDGVPEVRRRLSRSRPADARSQT